jgi:hypothetical protein
MMESTSGSPEGTSGPSRAGPAGGVSGPPRNKVEQDKLAQELLAALAEPKSKVILHPDMVKQIKANIFQLEQAGATRNLTHDEIIALSMHRRSCSEHARGLAWLATKSVEERQSIIFLKEKH